MAHEGWLFGAANHSRLEMSTEFFMVPTSAVYSLPTTEQTDSIISVSVHRSPVPYQNGLFRREIWVPPLLILSILTMVLIVLFEVSLSSCNGII